MTEKSLSSPFPLLLIAFIVTGCFANSFETPWHSDDYQVIVNNPHLHIDSFSFDALRGATRAASDGGRYLGERLYRPLPNVSFALNWLVGGRNVLGYHIVNLLIHIFTGCFLYLTCLQIFHTPRLKGQYSGKVLSGASLLCAVLWAVHPIQTQAITYIVQRMASMAAAFYVVGLYCYLRARLGKGRLEACLYYCAVVICFFCSVGSKENGLMLPFSLVLLELLFFNRITFVGDFRKSLKVIFGGVVFFCGAVYLAYLFELNSFSFLHEYEERPFSLSERVMTEWRIIFMYLSQLFFPLASRFSFIHDVVISNGLFSPPQTTAALLGLTILTGVGLWQIKRRPLLSLAILFYLLNHLIESTIVPLQLIFEHRNYLPSMFLFLPFTVLVCHHIYEQPGRRFRRGAACLLSTILIVYVGFNTYLRNEVWSTSLSLWLDTFQKAPNSIYPTSALATMYFKQGEFDVAEALYLRSLQSYSPHPPGYNARIYNALGELQAKKHRYPEAFAYFDQALVMVPEYERPTYNSASLSLMLGDFPTAEEKVNKLLEKRRNEDFFNRKGYVNFLILKSMVFLHTERPSEAVSLSLMAYEVNQDSWQALINIGRGLEILGKPQSAKWFLERARELVPDNIYLYLALLQNSVLQRDVEGQENALATIIHNFGISRLKETIELLPSNYLVVPFDERLLQKTLVEWLDRQKREIIDLELGHVRVAVPGQDGPAKSESAES